jgi:hypothetical protein
VLPSAIGGDEADHVSVFPHLIPEGVLFVV